MSLSVFIQKRSRLSRKREEKEKEGRREEKRKKGERRKKKGVRLYNGSDGTRNLTEQVWILGKEN